MIFKFCDCSFLRTSRLIHEGSKSIPFHPLWFYYRQYLAKCTSCYSHYDTLYFSRFLSVRSKYFPRLFVLKHHQCTFGFLDLSIICYSTQGTRFRKTYLFSVRRWGEWWHLTLLGPFQISNPSEDSNQHQDQLFQVNSTWHSPPFHSRRDPFQKAVLSGIQGVSRL